MDVDTRTRWAIVLVLACMSVVAAQQPPVFRTNTDLVLVPVSVTDRTGRFVGGLKADHFEILDSGVRRAVTQFSAGRVPISLAILLDVSGSMMQVRSSLEKRIAVVRSRLERVEDAFLHERKIDAQSYTVQRDKLREQIASAELELSEVRIEQFDVEGILSFAEYVLTNAARMWMELDLDRRQQLQQVLFPEGLSFDGERFGTAVTCLAFKKLGENGEPKSGMASPMPASWNQIATWLRRIDGLRRAA